VTEYLDNQVKTEHQAVMGCREDLARVANADAPDLTLPAVKIIVTVEG